MDIQGRPNHIEDYLSRLHIGQWYGWGGDMTKVYENLIIHDESKAKPTEQECIDGLAQLQSDFDAEIQAKIDAKVSGNQKLLDLGLTQAEATALTGYTPPVAE